MDFYVFIAIAVIGVAAWKVLLKMRGSETADCWPFMHEWGQWQLVRYDIYQRKRCKKCGYSRERGV